MKKLLLPLFFITLFAPFCLRAQDTLVFKDGTRMACRIKKLSGTGIEFVKWEKQQGPLYTAEQEELKKIIFEKGVFEITGHNSKTAAAQKQKPYRHSIKTDLFAPLFHKITLGYEYVFESGTAIELYTGFISGDILRGSPRVSYASNINISGYHFKAGVKFNLGEKDHAPLQGFFMRLDLLVSSSKVHNMYRNLQYISPTVINAEMGNMVVQQYGISYGAGYQFLFPNRMTLALQGGIGYVNNRHTFTGLHMTSFYHNAFNGYDEFDTRYYENKSLTNALTFSFMAPVYFTGNIALGFAFGK